METLETVGDIEQLKEYHYSQIIYEICYTLEIYAIQSVPLLKDLKSNGNIEESQDTTYSLRHLLYNILLLLPHHDHDLDLGLDVVFKAYFNIGHFNKR